MTEERKFAILFAATLMCARQLMEIEEKPSPVRMSTVDRAIRNAAYILSEIDKKWPTKAPAPFFKLWLCVNSRYSLRLWHSTTQKA
jgi:hypothetical protein